MSSENKFKNEKIIKIGEVEILLRPTFENICNLESKMGGVQYLAFKYAKGLPTKEKMLGMTMADLMKNLPTLTDCAQIIYFCQARHNPDDDQKKEYSLEEIFYMLQGSLKTIPQEMLSFISSMLAGNKNTPDLSEGVKKNLSKKTPAKNR